MKSRIFESWISNGPVFKWWSYCYSPNNLNTRLFKILTFVRISTGRASGFKVPFKIRTICNPSKSRLAWISGPNCDWITFEGIFWNCIIIDWECFLSAIYLIWEIARSGLTLQGARCSSSSLIYFFARLFSKIKTSN